MGKRYGKIAAILITVYALLSIYVKHHNKRVANYPQSTATQLA
jgi:hypothetical protein